MAGMTLTKLAKLANVSVSTASKAFSMSPEVNSETREMIFDKARELRCFKQFFSAKYPRLVVAVICPELESRYYSGAVGGLRTALEARGCEITAAASGFSAKRAAELVSYYENYADADAVISFEELPERAWRHEIPVIGLCRSAFSADVRILTDCNGAIKKLTDGFLRSGIKKIGFIGEVRTAMKAAAFREALGESYDPAFVSVTEERFEKGGYLAADRLISSGNLPEAVICAYDYMAYGAMRRFKDAGLEIPSDILVAGMDDLDESAYYIPSLTSVDMRSGEKAELAAEALFRLIRGEKADNAVLPAAVVARESTGNTVI